MKEQIKCYCGHTITCDCSREVETDLDWFNNELDDILKLIENGEILNELDFERAMIADRKLRVLSKENPKFKSVRKKLRDLIEQYENKNWSADSNISDKKLREDEKE